MATNGGNIVVPVGVQLELNNVQDIINSLQKSMSNVKPDTKGYASIVSELSKAEKKADALASKLKQGFTTNAGIQSFTKGFEDLVALVDTVNSKVAQINFDNLTLTAEQQAQMEAFAKQIEAAKNAYNAIETNKIQEAVKSSQELKTNFDNLKINADTTTLDNAIKTIKAKVDELQKEIDSSEKKAVSKETQAARRQSEVDQIKELRASLKKDNLTQDFSQFFNKNGDFKSNGKQAFIRLLEQLGLDDATVEKVKNTAGSKIKEIQEELDKALEAAQKRKNKSRIDAQNAANEARADVNTKTKEQASYQTSKNELDAIKNSPEIVQGEKAKQDAIRQTTAEIQKQKEEISKKAKGNAGTEIADNLADALNRVRESGGAAAAELANLDQRTKTVSNIKNAISMWMGFNQVLRLSRTAIRNMISDIRALDKVMTEIAVVTKMSQADLWNQMNTYQNIAKQYGVATTGVYQVSQIYYQQGLQTADVMALTNETLKMAKIAGLDYGAAADYMTVAIRGFKMEMTDAQTVVDVYSNLAAKSASNTTELATAMSKTASSAAAVGSSFENTSAMIAMMVETTRESAENIGSALKSIISRYGEMTSDPSKLVDSEGEALSLNKVDKALQSIGISLHDAQGQFRDFDDVILELSSKWDTLDKNSQRYIATIMAGNRQQSRFLALVSDYDRLSELTEEAANAEDASLVQTLKTMDSLETKIQNVKNAFQGFYGNLGLENVFKGALDVVTNIINRLNAMPKVFNKIPIAAIGMVANIINVIKTLGTTLITVTTAKWQQISEIIKENIAKGFKEGTDEGTRYAENGGSKVGQQYNKKRVGIAAAGRAASMIGTGISTAALTIGDENAKTRGTMEIGGGILTGVGQGIATGAMIGGPWGAAIGGITGVVSALPSLVAGINDVTHAEELRIKAMRESVEKSNQEAVLANSEARNLENTIEKLEKLSAAKNESNEAYQEWLDYVNQIASNYPELISMYDSEGNAVINMAEAYEKLAQSRAKAAQASLDAQVDSLKTQQAEIKRMQKITNETIAPENAGDKLGKGLSNVSGAFVDENGNLNIGLNSNEIADIAKDYLTDIFEEISTYGDNLGKVSQFKLKASGIEAVQNWTAEDFGGNKENLEIARNAMADLFYEQFIAPLAKEGYLSDIGFENEEDIQKLVEGWDPEDIVQKYLDIMSQINSTVQSNAELEEKIGELEEKKRSADLALQKWAEDNISAIDGFSKEKVSKFSGDSFMQTILEKNMPEEYVTNNGFNAAGQNIINDLFDFYNQIDEDTYKEVTSILAHPENYTSKLDLRAALAQILGNDELTGKLIEYITKTGEDGTSYLEDIWQKQVRSLQNKFQSNLSSSKQNKNSEIQESIDNLLDVGDGFSSNGEIAAQYLNDINKQWTDLVTKQKNEAVATQNAKFLADTYLNVSELSEEANGAMANILSNAELNTREGIQKAIDQIREYQDSHDLEQGEEDKLNELVGQLQEHKDNLLLNLNTELQQYANSLSDAVKNVNQNYTNNTSGFSELKDANEALQKINSDKIGSEQLTFDEAFKFDESLGKYVYTVRGLIEANNKEMEDINSQYDDATEQLDFEKKFLTVAKDTMKGFSAEDIVDALTNVSLKEDTKLSEQSQQILGQIAEDFKKSNLTWDEFIENRLEELEKLGISAEEAKTAAENMTREAQKDNAFKAIDFSSIASGAKKFKDVRNELINFYIANLGFSDEEWGKLQEQEKQAYYDQIEAQAGEAYKEISKGGESGAQAYIRFAQEAGQSIDTNIVNALLNSRVSAIASIGEKLKTNVNSDLIQLTDAEKQVLDTSVGAMTPQKLAEEYNKLIQEVRDGVKQGQIALETANAAIIQDEFGDEIKFQNRVNALTSVSSSGAITAQSLETLANAFGVLADIPEHFDISGMAGVKKIDGKNVVTNVEAFLADFNTLLQEPLTGEQLDEITQALNFQDKNKIVDAAVQAENSIIESIASEINNIKSAGIDKKVNLTALQMKLGDNSLTSIFGNAYQDGMLTVTETVKANMYTSLQELRSQLKAKNYDTSELDKTLVEYMNSAISEMSEFTGAMTVSDETAQILASQSALFKDRLESNGKITLNTIRNFAQAANAVYTATTEQYNKGLANLTQLNSAYSNIIKSNLTKQAAGFNMLTSASKIDLSSLQNFLNVYNKKLSDYVDKMGNLTTAGATAGLKSLGNGNYQIADWHKFISQLQITANELSTEYIDAYVSWLQSDANVAPNAKEALITSLIPNMEKLSYAQIGQIAKTFNKTVDYVLALVENNGDNTFNANALINSLDFDKTNEEFARALATQMQSVTSNMTSAMIAFVEAGSDGHRTDLDFSNLKNAISDFEKGMQALGQNVSVQNLVRALTKGGETAVAAAEQIAALSGQELSASDIESLYRGQVSKLVNAIDTIVAQPGEIVDQVTASLIGFDNVNEIGETGQYVVETAANLYEAYNKLLQRLRATGEATLADLNKVAALTLENRKVDGSTASEQSIIDALGDAANMTYTRFGEILTAAGYELSEELVKNWSSLGIIKDFGGSKMAITDFSKFADVMGWEAGSEEYTSAFKTYNDSMIQMNRQAERNILEEVTNVGNAKGGDWINLTQLVDKMRKNFANSIDDSNIPSFEVISLALSRSLENYGAKIENGILKLDSDANIPMVFKTIADNVIKYGELSSTETAELLDAIQNALSQYVDLLGNGLDGVLTHGGAEQLKNFASGFGINDITFTETAKGLKISTDEAYKLYQAIKKIDATQGNLAFEKLQEVMRGDKGGDFSSASKTMAAVARVQKEIAANQNKVNKAHEEGMGLTFQEWQLLDKQNQKLQEKKELYESIAQEMSYANMDNPESFDFMNQDIPDVMQGPINYWTSVGEAFSAMNEAHKTGKMEIQDFYNIVNEMNNLVAATNEAVTLGYDAKGNAMVLDGSLESAAAIIEQGMGALTNVDGKGVKVNLEKLGIDFVSGTDNAKSNFTEGVHKLAESQIAMLDAAIKILEVVVAMEQLGNIDVDNNGVFSIGDIFQIDANGELIKNKEGLELYTKEFQTFAQDLIKQAEANKDLNEALESVKINGITMKKLFQDAADGIKNVDLDADSYFKVMDAFVKAAQSNDWDLDHIFESVRDIIDSTFPDGMTVDVGDKTFVISGGTIGVVDWNDEGAKQALEYFEGKVEDSKAAVEQSLSKYQNGTGDKIDVLIGLAVNGNIEIDVNENGSMSIIGPGGEEINPNSEAGRQRLSKAALEAAGIENGQVITAGGHFIRMESEVNVGTETRLVFTDAEGNVKYHSDRTGKDYNSKQELIDAEVKQLQMELESKGTPVSYGEAYELIYHEKYQFEPKIESDLNEPEIAAKAREIVQQGSEKINGLLKEAGSEGAGAYTYTISENDKTITFDLNGVKVTVANTGNLQQDLNTALETVEDGLVYTDLITQISTGIKDAFTNDTSIGESIGEGIATAMSNYTITIDEFGNISIKQKPLKEAAQDGMPEIDGLKTEGEATVEPTEAEVDEETLKSKAKASAEALTDIPLPSVGAQVALMHIQSIGGADVDSTAAEGAAQSATIPTVDSLDGKVTLLNIKKVGSAKVDTAAAEGAADSATAPTIDEMDGNVTTLNVTPTSAPVIKTEGLAPSEITTPLEANAETVNATAGSADVSNLQQKIQEALNKQEFEVKIKPVVGDSGGNPSPSTPDTSSLDGLSSALTDLNSKASTAAEQIGAISKASTDAKSDELVAASKATTDANALQITSATKAINDTKSAQTILAAAAINTIKSGGASDAQRAINGISASNAQSAQTAINGIKSASAILAAAAINSIKSTGAVNAQTAINKIDAPDSLSTSMSLSISGASAKGNMPGVAKAKGSNMAMAGGTRKTLMGELGPELVVSNGRYFLVGENGAEFVDLASDAIVFNHLQTRRLFEQGAIGGRGHAVTNEHEAVAYAKGKIPFNGPAASGKQQRQDTDAGTGNKEAAEQAAEQATGSKNYHPKITTNFKKRTGKINWYKGKLEGSSLKSNGSKTVTKQFSVNQGETKQLSAKIEPLNWGTNFKTASHYRKKGSYTRTWGGFKGPSSQGPTSAKGSIRSIGSAMAGGASAALAELKQLRAMWESLLNATMADMGGMPRGSGGGGGGGGGGNDNDDTAKAVAGITAEVERWYNWLKLIEATQNKINLLTKEYDLLVSKGAGSKDLADNLKEQAKLLNIQISTARALAKEQISYRKKLINEANAGFMSAFYRADTETGQIYLANDDAFKKYIDSLGNQYSKAYENAAKGKLEYSKTNVDTEKVNKKYNEWLKTDEGKSATAQAKKDKKAALKQEYTTTKTFKVGKIKTGLDLMQELQRTNKAGKLVHDAAGQIQILKQLGLYDSSLESGVDKTQEGWESQVMQNFYDKVESDKSEIEALNKSIQEQQEAEKEFQKQLQEINNQLIEMARPVQGVTEHLEKWYNWTRKIVEAQNQLNILATRFNQLQNKLGDNRAAQLKNLKDQVTYTKEQLENTKQERRDRSAQLRKDLQNAGATNVKVENGKVSANSNASLYGGIYTLDENGNMVYNSSKFFDTKTKKTLTKEQFDSLSSTAKNKYKLSNGKYQLKDSDRRVFSITKKSVKLDNGNYIKSGITKTERDAAEQKMDQNKLVANLKDKISKSELNKLINIDSKYKDYYDKNYNITKAGKDARKTAKTAYNNAAKTVNAYDNGVVEYIEKKGYTDLDVSNPEKFLNELTAKDKYGNSIYTEQQQAEILKQAGFGDKMQYVNGTKYFDSLATATQEELNAAAKAYLEYIKQVPEEYNKAKDAISENVQSEEELKNKILEINNQIRELTQPIQGATDHLERWYNWTQKIIASQNQLNKLTIDYNSLQLKRSSSADLVDNLKNQIFALNDQIKYLGKELEGRSDQFNADIKLAGGTTNLVNGLFKLNDDNRVVYNGSDRKIQSQKDVSDIKVTQIKEDRDSNNAEKRNVTLKGKKEESMTFEGLKNKNTGLNNTQLQNLWDSSVVSTKETSTTLKNLGFENSLTSQQFIEKLTKANQDGTSKLAGDVQAQVLRAYGFENLLKSVGGLKNWNEASAQELADAAEKTIKYIQQFPEEMNSARDSIVQAEQEQLNLKNQIAETNQKIRDLLKPVAGVTNGLTEWYNETKKIEGIQNKLNKLLKQYTLYQNDQKANGVSIYNSLVKQRDALQQQIDTQTTLIKNRQSELNKLASSTLSKTYFTKDTNGNYLFKDNNLNEQTISTIVQEVVLKDGKETFDSKGRLNTANKKYTFDIQQGESLSSVLSRLTEQSANGKVAYNAQTQYDVLKALGLENYMKYDESGNQLYENFGELDAEIKKSMVAIAISRIQKSIDEINDVQSDIAKLQESNLDLQNSIYDITKTLQSNAIEVEKLMKDAVVQEKQTAIDNQKELKDAFSKVANKTIAGLRDKLDKDRQKYESDQSNKELSNLQTQLMLLQRSGGSISQIRDLQNQISEKQKDIYFTAREDEINTIEDTANKQIERLDTQIEIMQTALDYQVKMGTVWDQINTKLAESTTSIQNYLQQQNQEFAQMSPTERSKWLVDTLEQVQLYRQNRTKTSSVQDIVDATLNNDTRTNKINSLLSDEAKARIVAAGQYADVNGQDVGQAVQNRLKVEQNDLANTKWENAKKADDFKNKTTYELNKAKQAYVKEYIKTGNESDATTAATKAIKTITDDAKTAYTAITSDAENAYTAITSGKTDNSKTKSIKSLYDNVVTWYKNKKGVSAKTPQNALQDYYINLSRQGKTSDQIKDIFGKIKTQDDFQKKILVNYLLKNKNYPISIEKQSPYYTSFDNKSNKPNSAKKETTEKISKVFKGEDAVKFKKGYFQINGLFYPDNVVTFLWGLNKETVKKQLKPFKQGGIVDFTGPAWVDGTKSKPEQIFNYDQMKKLREMFFENLATTQIGISNLSSIAENLPNTAAYNSINNTDNGINIDKLEFHMEVQEISNDYDARRAGQEAMAEMVRIARKTGNNSISRR